MRLFDTGEKSALA